MNITVYFYISFHIHTHKYKNYILIYFFILLNLFCILDGGTDVGVGHVGRSGSSSGGPVLWNKDPQSPLEPERPLGPPASPGPP